MSDEIQKLILAEMKEVRSDIKTLYEKINSNYTELTKEINSLDKKVLGNKFKLGAMISFISICWGIVIHVLRKKLL